MPAALNVARWLERSEVNGPGERFVLWLQGCPLRCPGCWNPDTWDFAPRRILEAEELVALVSRRSSIKGITLTGGEPFAQAEALVPVARALRQRGLSIMVFTGYELAELRSPAALQLLQMVDIMVTGRYREEARTDALAWRGSTNQKLLFLTDRYSELDLQLGNEMRVEAHIGSGGELVLTGFPEERFVGDGMPARLEETVDERHQNRSRSRWPRCSGRGDGVQTRR